MRSLVKPGIFGLLVLSIGLQSCRKEELPTILTSSITNVIGTCASGGGKITSDGGAQVISRGVCWSENINPTTSDSKTNDGNGIGQFVSTLYGLTSGTTYHVRAYATNSVGTSYGSEIVFTTLGEMPEAKRKSAPYIPKVKTKMTLNHERTLLVK